MKRKISFIMAMLLMVTLMVACGNSQTSNGEGDNTSTQLNDENKVNQVTDNDNVVSESQEADEPEFTIINLGDNITTDFLEMTIESASEAQELKPTDTSSVYSYMPDKDAETYFYLTGNMKNVSGDTYSVEDMCATFCFDDKYNYTAYIAADNGGNDFYGDSVKPFGSVKYYLYSSIPDELINSYSTCVVKFGFHDNFEHDYKDDFNVYEHIYKITLTK